VKNRTNPLKTVKNREKVPSETLTRNEICEAMKMSWPTLVKLMKKKGVKPIQNGRGGKMWFTARDLEALQNGR